MAFVENASLHHKGKILPRIVSGRLEGPSPKENVVYPEALEVDVYRSVNGEFAHIGNLLTDTRSLASAPCPYASVSLPATFPYSVLSGRVQARKGTLGLRLLFGKHPRLAVLTARLSSAAAVADSTCMTP